MLILNVVSTQADIGCGHICVSSRLKASSGQGGGCSGKKQGLAVLNVQESHQIGLSPCCCYSNQ